MHKIADLITDIIVAILKAAITFTNDTEEV